MNWFPVLVFISLYSLCATGVVVQKRSSTTDDDDQDSMFGRFVIGQMLGSDAGLDVSAYQASNSSDLIQIIGEYIVEIFKKEDKLFVEKCKQLLKSDDLEKNLNILAEASKRLERIVTGSFLEETLMEDPRFLEQHAKVSLENAANGEYACSDPIPDIGKVDGSYGEPSKLNLTEEIRAVSAKVKTNAKVNGVKLAMLDFGFGGKPDPESRLGAFYATRGYTSGTVGSAIHRIVGAMYLFLGTVGEEKIGRIYNNQDVKALLNQPIESGAIRCVAAIEELYFENVKKENPESAAAVISSFVTSRTRDCLTKLITGVLCS